MKVISVRNVHRALPEGIRHLILEGIHVNTRVGVVRRSPEPVATRYDRPWERVVFWPERDANPFFHYLETIWMLAGENRLDYLVMFNKRMAEYSDDGLKTHAGYGHRLITQNGDQIKDAIDMLKKNHADRRVVLQIWDSKLDLGRVGKDVPCNFAIDLKIVQGKLQFIVHCRSNDIIWGAYGANAVHMSMIHQVIAELVGVPMGPYFQISDDYHGYKDTMRPLYHLADEVETGYERKDCWYSSNNYTPRHLVANPVHITTDWDAVKEQCQEFVTLVANAGSGAREALYSKRQTRGQWAYPMLEDAALMVCAYQRYQHWTGDRAGRAHSLLSAYLYVIGLGDAQWAEACNEWLKRRETKWLRAKDDGVHA